MADEELSKIQADLKNLFDDFDFKRKKEEPPPTAPPPDDFGLEDPGLDLEAMRLALEQQEQDIVDQAFELNILSIESGLDTLNKDFQVFESMIVSETVEAHQVLTEQPQYEKAANPKANRTTSVSTAAPLVYGAPKFNLDTVVLPTPEPGWENQQPLAKPASASLDSPRPLPTPPPRTQPTQIATPTPATITPTQIVAPTPINVTPVNAGWNPVAKMQQAVGFTPPARVITPPIASVAEPVVIVANPQPQPQVIYMQPSTPPVWSQPVPQPVQPQYVQPQPIQSPGVQPQPGQPQQVLPAHLVQAIAAMPSQSPTGSVVSPPPTADPAANPTNGTAAAATPQRRHAGSVSAGVTPTPTPAPKKKAFTSIEDMVLDPDYDLLKALAMVMQVTEATKTCSALIKIFIKHDLVIDMINALIFNEVDNQSSAGTLFRNNSIATHMMTCYTKAVGIPYLTNTVAPEILHVFEQLEEGSISYEIDPEKVGSSQAQNISNLKGLIHRFFDRILNSRSFMPKTFLQICNSLQNATKDRFPESKYSVIGGFLFLRYLCPSIVAPDGYKLIKGIISEEARRTLVLVSKILQTIANEREFGDKEDYMICMNNLVREYQSALQYFFNSLAKPPDPMAPLNIQTHTITPEDYAASMKIVVEQIRQNQKKLLDRFAAMPAPDTQALVNAIENYTKLPVTTPNYAPLPRRSLLVTSASPVSNPGGAPIQVTPPPVTNTPPAANTPVNTPPLGLNGGQNLIGGAAKYVAVRRRSDQVQSNLPSPKTGSRPSFPGTPPPTGM